MATESFYILKDKKKKNLIDSIENCLKTKSFEKISIEDILQEAEISRGSFYKYFSDKTDAVLTYVDARIKYLFEIYKICIMECNNKLFDGTVEAYNILKYMLKDSVYIAFYNNFKFLFGVIINDIYSKKYQKEMDDLVDWCIVNSVESKEKNMNREMMVETLDMLFTMIIATTLKMATLLNEEIDNIEFSRKIGIIKKGIMG